MEITCGNRKGHADGQPTKHASIEAVRACFTATNAPRTPISNGSFCAECAINIRAHSTDDAPATHELACSRIQAQVVTVPMYPLPSQLPAAVTTWTEWVEHNLRSARRTVGVVGFEVDGQGRALDYAKRAMTIRDNHPTPLLGA